MDNVDHRPERGGSPGGGGGFAFPSLPLERLSTGRLDRFRVNGFTRHAAGWRNSSFSILDALLQACAHEVDMVAQ
jgi:hypothetical protein